MGQQNNSRRKFLSTSVAAPVVLTVQSASATVTPPSSSSLCRTNDARAELPAAGYVPPPGTGQYAPDPDAWLRIEVPVYQIRVRSTNAVVDGLYVAPYGGGAGNYWRIDTPTVQLSQYVVNGADIEALLVPSSVRRGLVLVDGSNNIVGYAWQTSISGQRITKSCWSSFK